MWLDDESCQAVIDNGWYNPGSNSSTLGVMGKISQCANDLKDWEWHLFGNVNHELARVRKELVDLQEELNGDKIPTRRELRDRLRNFEKREEMLWFQRARAYEFRWGDRNTEFFHQKASGWKKRNEIKKLTDENGLIWRSYEGKVRVA